MKNVNPMENYFGYSMYTYIWIYALYIFVQAHTYESHWGTSLVATGCSHLFLVKIYSKQDELSFANLFPDM